MIPESYLSRIVKTISMKINNDMEDFIVHSVESFSGDESFEVNAKKIYEAVKRDTAAPKHKYMGYRCPCGNEVAKNQKYCDECGQKLLPWEERK